MRKLLLKWIELLQKRVASKKDDPRDWEWIEKKLEKLWITKNIND